MLSPRSDDGFTLVELVVVVVIIGILAAIAIPLFRNQVDAANDTAVASDLTSARNAVVSYGVANEGAMSETDADLKPFGLSWSASVTNHTIDIDPSGSFCIAATSASGTRFALTSSSPIAPGTC
jgi:prepilin-type N-terminal cleavage/methylation domain-containing protein